jgi:hypothetical protein
LVRLPISSSKEGNIEIGGSTYPIYESLCLIMKDDEISESGIYYISQNRHGIPLRLRSSLKDMEVYFWETNNDLISKEEFITLLNHGIRTVREKNNFYLFCRAYNTPEEKYVSDMVSTYNNEADVEVKNRKYIEMLELFIKAAEDRDDFHRNVTVSLPTRIPRKFVSDMDKSLLSKQPKAITNILFRSDTDKETKSVWVGKQLNDYLSDKDKMASLYGLYSIISISDGFESDTYGFLKNNLRPSSIGMGMTDYIDFIKGIKSMESEENVVQKRYDISYLNNDVKEGGYLDI